MRSEVDTTTEFYGNSDDRFENFTPVDFVGRARELWTEAMEVNDHDAGMALGAFCYACCEKLSDYQAYPTDVFKVTKKKAEEGGEKKPEEEVKAWQ